jgi:hypothetical protein
MVRALLRLTLLALALHAGVRTGPVFWRYLQFKDAVIEAATYSARQTPAQVRDRVVALAREHRIPITHEDVWVAREGETTYVSTSWTAELEYLPTRTYPHEFVVDVIGRADRTGALAP